MDINAKIKANESQIFKLKCELKKVNKEITELRAEGYEKYLSHSCRFAIDGTCILFDDDECWSCECGEP